MKHRPAAGNAVTHRQLLSHYFIAGCVRYESGVKQNFRSTYYHRWSWSNLW